MKLLKKTIYALSLMSMVGLWSCSSEEVLPGDTTALKGEKVPVTITVSRDDATRTELSENKTNGGLNDVWCTGDKLAVYNADGIKAGELNLIEGEDTSVGIFSGEVTAEEGEHEFNLWYTAPEATGLTEANGKPIYFNSKKEMIVDLSKMPKYEDIKSLSAMDILSKVVKLSVSGGKANVVESKTMQSHLALARFSLRGMEVGKKGTLTISDLGSANGMTIYKSRINLIDGIEAGTISHQGGIVIKDVEGGKDIYMAFIPGTYRLGFHYVVDGVSYDYAFTKSTTLKAGVYYNAFTKAEGAEEGVIDGVDIPLQKEVFAELHIHANFDGASPEEIVITKPFDSTPKADFNLEDYSAYSTLPTPPAGYTFLGWSQEEDGEVDATSVTISSIQYNKFHIYAVWQKSVAVDHSKNPLAQWAESDLMNKEGTSGSGYTGRETGNWGTTGDYYQFGRNKGWVNPADVKNNYNYTAVAMFDSNWAGASQKNTSIYYPGYGTVNTTYLTNPYKGVGDATIGNWYNANTKMASLPEYFIYAGNESFEHWDGEYVFDTTIRNKHTWAQRAEYCGYTYSDPCPEGYRIPTLDDWRKILPKGGHTYSTGATSDFAPFAEIKEDGDVKYAIRWSRYVSSNNKQYLKIDALVVPSNVTNADNVDWSDSNVVTRYFKGAGAIKPSFFLARHIYNGSYSYQWVAQAQPICKFSYTYSYVTSTLISTNITITRDDTDLGGYYWVDDVQHYAVGFRFDKNNVQQQGSYINVFKFRQPYACNIRCIKK